MKTTSKRYSAEFKGKVAMEAVEDRADTPASVDRDAVPPAVDQSVVLLLHAAHFSPSSRSSGICSTWSGQNSGRRRETAVTFRAWRQNA